MWRFSLQLCWQWVPRLAVLGSIYLLSACATLSKQECRVGDWQVIGYNDGIAGYAADRLASHIKLMPRLISPPTISYESVVVS